LSVDLYDQIISVADERYPFDIDPHRRESLLEGLDDIGLTLKQMDLIRAWQATDRKVRRWVWDPIAAGADSK